MRLKLFTPKMDLICLFCALLCGQLMAVETFKCDFDDGVCDVFIQSLSDDADWKTRVVSDSQLEGANRDHTGKSGGQYLYPDFKNATDGDEAILMSPRINTTADQSCLVFWYVLVGEEEHAGSLRINVSSPDLTDQRTVWSISSWLLSFPNDIWTRAAITLDTSEPMRITLWATLKRDSVIAPRSTVSIDDIELKNGPCLSEIDVNRQFSCSFEEPDLCGLGQMTMEDDIDWMWHSGATFSSATGPSSDHTTGNGYYLYVESSSHRTPGDKAVLYTPTIHPTFPVSCLTLYIHRYGSFLNRTNIYQANSSSGFSLDLVESFSTESGNTWIKSTTELKTTEPYKIFIEGSVGNSHTGDMAIDDMEIKNNECSPVAFHSMTCTFDDGCDFVQWHLDDFDWIHKGRVSSSAGPGPSSSPHSGGSYMYIDVDGTRSPGDSAVLVSHVMHTLSTQQSCLVFKYHLHGAFVGQLTLQLADPFLESNVTVWSVDRETGDRWNRAAFSIDTADPVRLLFVGTVGTGTGIIAVDDVTMRQGSCPYGRPAVARFKCDFEDPDLCWFRQDPDTSDIDWLWQTGPTPDGPDTGPAGDHTTGQGHYVYIESSPPQNALEKAVLYSPDIAMGAPEQCLTFWYSMSGAHIGELEVMKDSTSLLRIKGDQGPGWKEVSLTLEMDPSQPVFQLSWHGKVGPGDKGDIAIDDIELSLMPCPTEPESVNCTFSDSHRCGYTQPDKNDMDWIQSEGYTTNTSGSPLADHTTGHGLFMYVVKELFPKAVLVSRTLDWDVRDNCLKFDYSMVGETIGRLNVYLASAENLNDRMLMWTRDTANATMWQNVEIDFELAFPQKIIFEAVRGPGSSGDIAIDNVKVLPHKCRDDLTCDFELCFFDTLYTLEHESAWLRHTAQDSPHISDHTNGKDGKYVKLVLFITIAGILQTNILTTNSSGEVCLAFWYQMVGKDPGLLIVFAADPNNHTMNRNDLWKRKTGVDQQWTLAEVNINTTEPVRVYFEGTGSRTTDITVALDDISIRRQPCGPLPLEKSPADCDFDDSRCGYTELNRDRLLAHWIHTDGATPTMNTGPDEDSPGGFSGKYVYMETTLPKEGSLHQTSILISPELTDTPRRICLRFWYHMQGSETGTLVVGLDSVSGVYKTLWLENGDQGAGWQLAEVNVDVMKPSKIKFVTVIDWSDGSEQLFGNVGLDDVEVIDGTCYPVPWTEEWRFRCDRSSTQCVGGQGQCNAATLLCDCEQGFHGPQCQYTSGAFECSNNLCLRGSCYNDTVCVCPDGYYGDKCEHKMVQAECTRDKMVVNVFPYGFTDLASWNIKHPENANHSCKLQPVNQLGAYGSKGWQGFVGEFLHKNDPCAGSATVEEETVEWITFSRELLVYTDPLGRHISDTKLNVNCTVENLPEPHLAVDVKELGRRRKNSAGDVRVLTFIEILFTLNIPNRETMTEIKVMDCTASNGVHTVTVVKNGCAMYPAGVMVYDGRQRGTEFLILQVYKKPSAPLALHFKCSVRLCDSRVDFFCYERAQCFQRVKRSARLDGEELKGNRIDVEYTYHLRP